MSRIVPIPEAPPAGPGDHPVPPPPPPPGPEHPAPPPPPPHPGFPGASFPFWGPFAPHDGPWQETGEGIDHHATGFGPFPFGPAGFEGWGGHPGFGGFWGRRGGFRPRGRWGPWGRHGHHGRRCRHGCPSDEEPSGDEEMRDVNASDPEKRECDAEKEGSPATLQDGEHPDPPEEVPFVRHERRGGRRGFGPRGGRHGPRGQHGPHGPHGHHGHHGPHGPHGAHFRHHHHGPPPPPPYNNDPEAANSFAAMMNGFANHPFAQRVREYVENVRAQAMAAARGHQDNGEFGDEDAFVPPVDIFNTDNNWTVHIALPGAKKEDIAVNWDAAKSSLAVSGVVYRPGDEVFLTGMVAGERKVGLFERSIQLPPAGNDDKEEVDGNGITAKLEDGILVVVVPKAEKEWTEVRKVDIL